jgi:phosphatidylglycerophosphatase A
VLDSNENALVHAAHNQHTMPDINQTITNDAAAAAAANSAEPAAAPIRPTARFMLSHPAHIVSLGFGSGLSPVAPGTVGTLLGWLSFAVLSRWLNEWQWGAVIAVSLVVGIWLSGITARALHTEDPGNVVSDEIVSFWLVLWLISPAGWLAQCIAFGLFRYFDAVKPGPVGWADRRFSGGFGVFADDVIAAFCTVLVFALWRFVTA